MKIKTLKSLALGLLVATAATAGYSQGEINFFSNNANTAKGNFFNYDGSVAGSAVDAQLWGSLIGGSTSNPNTWNALSAVITLTSTANGGEANDATLAQDNSDTFASGGGGTSDAGNFEWYQVRVWSGVGSWAATGITFTGNVNTLNISGLAGGVTEYGVTTVSGTTERVVLGGTTTDGDNTLYTVPQANNFNNLTLTATPEPTTLALAGLGGAALLALRRRKA